MWRLSARKISVGVSMPYFQLRSSKRIETLLYRNTKFAIR